VFFAAALAIVPAARLIVHGHRAHRRPHRLRGRRPAQRHFGNLPELIIATVALRSGLLEMVRASIIGAILANLLMALGVALLVGASATTIRSSTPGRRGLQSMMLLAVISLAGPGAFERVFTAAEHLPQIHALNVRLALMLMAVYALYLYFMLGTHAEEFAGEAEAGHGHGEGPAWSMARALGTLIGASVLAAWMSEILVGAAEGTGEALGMSQTFIGMIIVAVVGGAAESCRPSPPAPRTSWI
jgi:Ca2+:H+ antiporter